MRGRRAARSKARRAPIRSRRRWRLAPKLAALPRLRRTQRLAEGHERELRVWHAERGRDAADHALERRVDVDDGRWQRLRVEALLEDLDPAEPGAGVEV